MAESAVSFLIEYLGPLLVEEAKLLKGVRGEARRIRDELQTMRAFLRDADAREESEETIKRWVKQVREAAFDAEDVLDKFMLRLAQKQQNQRDAHGSFGWLRKGVSSIKQLKSRHVIGKEIQDVRAQLCDISKRKDDLNLNSVTQGPGSSYNSNDREYDPRLDALFVDESDLVGIDVPKRMLSNWLLNEKVERLSTISVVGMGGLGKTTLVSKVYDSDLVKNGFETHAWITVSQTFEEKDVLQSMITQFHEATQQAAPSRLNAMSFVELTRTLRRYLQNKRYLLVLDDVWTVDVWKFVSNALPSSQEYESRVILTTRFEEVALSCCFGTSGRIYRLQPLDLKKSWSLFCRKAFPLNAENTCPPELEELARSFVKKCRGLPLAVVTLASLLQIKDQTYAEWELTHRSLPSELENDDNLKRMTRILMLSYSELPSHLKPCFLYLSIFPEDYAIKRMKLIRLWMAEGFIERKEDRSPEEVAQNYLNALIARNLVQVARRRSYGQVQSIRIHDFVREITISRFKEEHFFASSVLPNTPFSNNKIRHLSIHNKGETVPKYDNCSRLRSLFIFGVDGVSNATMVTSFAGLRLLRVVDLENASMESFPEDLTSLFHLRYLSLEKTKIKNLPSSVGKLRNLETLNVKGTSVSEIPVEIVNLQNLRHLSVYHGGQDLTEIDKVHGTKVPAGIGSLTSLQKLANIEAESGIVRELGNLTQLRKLGLVKLRQEDGTDLCNCIKGMSHLEALKVTSIDEDEVIELDSLSRPRWKMTLQRLHLKGRLENVPHWISSLRNLVSIRLLYSRLAGDPLRALQSLPNLVELMLSTAYDGEKLRCDATGYPKLKSLKILFLQGLKQVKVKKGAMSSLETLWFVHCRKLVEVPFWLQHLTMLKEVTVIDMPDAFTRGLTKGEAEELEDFVQHVPRVRIIDQQKGLDLRLP